jgi:hypothetical protein
MNWYKTHTVYEFVLYNLHNNCMNWYKNYTKFRMTHRAKSATYVNLYKSIGWNSKKCLSLK